MESANERAVALVGTSAVGRAFGGLLRGKLPALLQAAQQALQEDRAVVTEPTPAPADGGAPAPDRAPVTFTAVPTHDAAGKAVGVVLYAQAAP